MRLPRPYIPLSVRVQVAERQMLALTGCVCTDEFGIALSESGASLRARLDAALFHLSGHGANTMHLDHDPALAARAKIRRNGMVVRYVPGANDPDFLVYRAAAAHRIKTNVRGEHGQHPDRVLIKRQRRLERPKRKRRSRPIAARKNPWPKSRKIRSL